MPEGEALALVRQLRREQMVVNPVRVRRRSLDQVVLEDIHIETARVGKLVRDLFLLRR